MNVLNDNQGRQARAAKLHQITLLPDHNPAFFDGVFRARAFLEMPSATYIDAISQSWERFDRAFERVDSAEFMPPLLRIMDLCSELHSKLDALLTEKLAIVWPINGSRTVFVVSLGEDLITTLQELDLFDI